MIYAEDDSEGFPEEIDMADPDITDIRLRDLLPEHKYLISIYARTRAGAGPEYKIEDTTLPSGRK